jgi:hypothetical protein
MVALSSISLMENLGKVSKFLTERTKVTEDTEKLLLPPMASQSPPPLL